MRYPISLLFSLFVGIAFAQEKPCFPVNAQQINTIKADVEYLASDELEGRSPGTNGALLAREYIAKRMKEIGLRPLGTSEYFQGFKVAEPVKVDAKNTWCVVKKDSLKLNEQFYPVQYATNAMVATNKTVWVGYGITAPEHDYDDYRKIESLSGKIAVMDVSSPDGIHPHSAYAVHHDLHARLKLAKEKGATAVVLVNLGDMAEDPSKKYKNLRNAELPVVFVKDDELAKKLKKGTRIAFKVAQQETDADAYNVVGFLDNKQPTTVVIGAHFDHLGYGDEGSLHTGEPAIHNGADDNASGTAALLALAEFVSAKTELTGHNYLFIAFTAEERGLLGSNYYVHNPTLPIENMAYMINMDMVGRLRDRELQISGVGTSKAWDNIKHALACYNFNLKLDKSGTGPSDHTSFYNQKMPVLHFFTGTHEDYHKPSDDADKINYKGIGEIVAAIKSAMAMVDSYQKLDYIETKNNNMRKASKFSVTLGVMPNYMYDDGGLKIDGVTAGKPAEAAGLQKGDIITQLGNFKIEDIYAYMKALGAFKKGDVVKMEYLRNGELMTGEVKF